MTPPEPTEHQEQALVIQWWGYTCSRYRLPDFALFAIPNAGAGSQRGQAGKMKAEGVRRGIPDLCLAHPVGRRHGLYIEMKRAHGGITSERQREVIGFLSSEGYDVVIAAGANEAMAAITAYLERR